MQPSWIHRLTRGDVVRSGSGMYRVVRAVSHHHITGYGIRTNVTFAIRHCSWTGRCYTVYTGNDLVQMGYSQTRARVSLRKKIDRLIEWELKRKGDPALMGCCDVEGVP